MNTNNKEYPEEFYRGISTNDCVTDEGYITASAFNFPKTTERGDNFCELSINWNDDDGSVVNLKMRHKKDSDERQFKIGYCVVNRKEMELIIGHYMKVNKIGYERKPEAASEENGFQENKYHGNLLMYKGIENSIRKNIEHSLASLAKKVHTWDD